MNFKIVSTAMNLVVSLNLSSDSGEFSLDLSLQGSQIDNQFLVVLLKMSDEVFLVHPELGFVLSVGHPVNKWYEK